MRINLIGKVLIASTVLSVGQKASARIPQQMALTIRNTDRFIPSNFKHEKTFDILKNIAEFLTGDFKSVSAKSPVKKEEKY
jgi:hypothetical protein